MKKLFLFTFVLASTVIKAQSEPISAFLEKWENSKNYLLDIAKAMPEKAYDYKPTEREMSFKEQLLHIRQNMLWLSTTYFSDTKFEKSQDIPATKEETIELLKRAFDKVYDKTKNVDASVLKEKVDFFAGEKTKLQILNLLQDHVTHHRGQLIVYLNLNNMEPPKYIGW